MIDATDIYGDIIMSRRVQLGRQRFSLHMTWIWRLIWWLPKGYLYVSPRTRFSDICHDEKKTLIYELRWSQCSDVTLLTTNIRLIDWPWITSYFIIIIIQN